MTVDTARKQIAVLCIGSPECPYGGSDDDTEVIDFGVLIGECVLRKRRISVPTPPAAPDTDEALAARVDTDRSPATRADTDEALYAYPRTAPDWE